MSTIVQNNGAQFAMISLAALANSNLAKEFTCDIDADSEACHGGQVITYFQQAQMYTSTFACFTQSLQAQGNSHADATQGGEVIFNISRVGDVLIGLTAVVDLPALQGDGTEKVGWVENLGHHLFKSCELMAQDTVIESFGSAGASSGGTYGVFMDCIHAMECTGGKKQLYDNMIGNTPDITGVRDRSGETHTPQIMCPLRLSFCTKNAYGVPAAPLPVCALAYCTLQVKLGLNKAQDVVYYNSGGAGDNLLTNKTSTPSFASSNPQYKVTMLAEYAMVSSKERAALACATTKQHVMHRQAQAKTVQPSSASDTTVVTFSGCNAYWFSIWQNMTPGSADGSAAGAVATGNLFTSNYTSGYRELGAGGNVIDVLDGTTNTRVNPVKSVKINADSSPIIDYDVVMTAWYSWWWKTGNDGCATLDTGMNLIPFCLTTEFYAIEANGGFLNLSKLTNVSEDTTLTAAASTDGSKPTTAAANAIKPKFTHYILSVSYNTIVVSGGTLQHPYY